MNHSLKIAALDDLTHLLPLVRDYHAWEGIQLSDAHRTEAIKPLLDHNPAGRIWLIAADERYIGYIALCFGYSIEIGGRDAFVDEFFILAPYRGRGIGRAVLKRIEDEARQLGIRALHLEVARTNIKAQELYASLGYKSRDRFHLVTHKLSRVC